MPARPPLLVPVLAAAGFVLLLLLVVTGWPPLERADRAVSEAFRGYGERHRGLVAVLRVVTDLAATWVYLTAGLVAVLTLLARGGRRAAACCALVTVAVPVLWTLGHRLIPHSRPLDGFVQVQTNSFPSGHTSNAAAAALVVVLLTWPRLRRRGRLVTVLAAAAFALVIGVTRVALLAHWPADVLGGWLLALVVVPLAAHLARGPAPDPPTHRST